jgi:hypothetical protein
VEFVKRWPRIFGFESADVLVGDLLARVVSDAEWAGSQVTTRVVGRLTIVSGEPDWISSEALFTELVPGQGANVRAPVYLSAFASAVATQRRGSQPVLVLGTWSDDELAALRVAVLDHERVVAFAC